MLIPTGTWNLESAYLLSYLANPLEPKFTLVIISEWNQLENFTRDKIIAYKHDL